MGEVVPFRFGHDDGVAAAQRMERMVRLTGVVARAGYVLTWRGMQTMTLVFERPRDGLGERRRVVLRVVSIEEEGTWCEQVMATVMRDGHGWSSTEPLLDPSEEDLERVAV